MATIDRRGATVSAADPPIGTNPNPDLAIKAPVRAATTGNITLSGLQTIDGVALGVGDRVLVKDQTNATANGLYNAATGPWTRTIDANNNSQFATGMLSPSRKGPEMPILHFG
jgi:phage-related tail fiber protein